MRTLSATGNPQSLEADPNCLGRPWRNNESGGSCGLGFELALLLPLLMRLGSRRVVARS